MTNIDAHWDYINHRPKTKASQRENKKASQNKNNQSPKRERKTSIFNCFGCLGSSTSGRSSAKSNQIVKFESKKMKDYQYNSPTKTSKLGTVEGITALNRVSEGSQVENLQASPYISNLLSNQKLQSSARGDSAQLSHMPEIILEDLWRSGIPVSIRRVLWPFKIGNKLGISKQLYQIHKQKGITMKWLAEDDDQFEME